MFSLLVLSVVVTLITLLNLKPGEDDTVAPPPGGPGFAMGVDEAVALPGGRAPSVAEASAVAEPRAKPVGRSAERDDGGAKTNVVLAVAPAHAVAVGAGGGAGPAPTESNPMPAPPVTEPVSTPPQPAPPSPPGAGGGSPGGPISAGVEPEPICEGDEYAITVAVEEGEEGAEHPSLDILLRRFGADGSFEEFHLEGDLLDAQRLAVLLTEEGNCVALQTLTPQGDIADEGSDPTPAEPSPPVYAPR